MTEPQNTPAEIEEIIPVEEIITDNGDTETEVEPVIEEVTDDDDDDVDDDEDEDEPSEL